MKRYQFTVLVFSLLLALTACGGEIGSASSAPFQSDSGKEPPAPVTVPFTLAFYP